MQKLDETELKEALAHLPAWALTNGALTRDWRFKDFRTAMDFVNRVATLAEAEAHHPDIDIRYNKVRLSLVTHDAGGITANDSALAAKLDRLVLQP